MVVCVSLAVAGLAVLGVLAVRVFREVRLLAGAVRSGSEELERAVADLETAVRPPAERARRG